MALTRLNNRSLSAVTSYALDVYDLPVGSVVQAVSDTSNATTVTTSTSYTSTQYSLAITPSSSSNKILCIFMATGETNAQGSQIHVRLTRSGSELCDTRHETYNSTGSTTVGLTYLDSPSTTSSTTYAIQILSYDGNTVVLNRGDDRGSLILLEVVG